MGSWVLISEDWYNSDLSIFYVRNGEHVELLVQADGGFIERRSHAEVRFQNFTSLLASPNYCNLGKWADNQSSILAARVQDEYIPVRTDYNTLENNYAKPILDGLLSNKHRHHNDSVSIALLDGPAGIGKTSLIRVLAYERASYYRTKRQSLIIHVESRGRVLQNIIDLIAFSLQTLRADVTYDQVPVLVRFGLICIAIDRFDELGDPNGYELAWAQVNDLVNKSRGMGTILSAGRETFIGKQRLAAALTSINPTIDIINAVTLQPIEPNVARSWLSKKGWPDELMHSDMVQPLFEHSSYALRPFFLSLLTRDEVRDRIAAEQIDDLLHFLVISMVEREADKFGTDINSLSSSGMRQKFIFELIEEVARDIAENQSESISGQNLLWLAEVSAQATVPDALIGVLKNRANVIAFLTEDDRRGFRRFLHVKLLNYFLSRATIRNVLKGEVPKYIRRNIFGLDFLQDFADVARKHKARC